MSKLVFIDNGRAVTDSLTVAEEFEKSHDDVLRDIRTQIDKLRIAGESEFSLRNFAESNYRNERGRDYPKFDMTEDAFAIVAMSYVTPKAMKMKVRFIEEFKKMREQINGSIVMSKELQAIFVLDRRTQEFDERLLKIENNTTIEHSQLLSLQAAANKVVTGLLGGTNSEAYQNNGLRSRVYKALWRDYKGYFNINSYHNTLVKSFDRALEHIESWKLPGQLQREIEETNRQMAF